MAASATVLFAKSIASLFIFLPFQATCRDVQGRNTLPGSRACQVFRFSFLFQKAKWARFQKGHVLT